MSESDKEGFFGKLKEMLGDDGAKKLLDHIGLSFGTATDEAGYEALDAAFKKDAAAGKKLCAKWKLECDANGAVGRMASMYLVAQTLQGGTRREREQDFGRFVTAICTCAFPDTEGFHKGKFLGNLYAMVSSTAPLNTATHGALMFLAAAIHSIHDDKSCPERQESLARIVKGIETCLKELDENHAKKGKADHS